MSLLMTCTAADDPELGRHSIERHANRRDERGAGSRPVQLTFRPGGEDLLAADEPVGALSDRFNHVTAARGAVGAQACDQRLADGLGTPPADPRIATLAAWRSSSSVSPGRSCSPRGSTATRA